MPEPAERLTFEESTHTYKLDGQVIPSVTQIIKASGLVDDQWFTEETALRGHIVHMACELDDKGTPNLDANMAAQYPDYVGYLEAWRKFKATNGNSTWKAIEQRLWHDTMRYAGRVDRLQERCIWDIKTGVMFPEHKLQTAAYHLMLTPCYKYMNRCVVYLQKTGKFSIRQHTDEGDYEAWTGYVAAHHWKTNNGVKI